MATLPDSFGWFHPHLQSYRWPRLNKEGTKLKGHEQGKGTLREDGVLKGVENRTVRRIRHMHNIIKEQI